MNLSWDENKRDQTRQHRGLDFADAAQVFAGFKIDQVDDRIDYGEERLLATGLVDDLVVVVVWTPRPGSRRIISMRKANAKEQARYRDALDRFR